MAARPIELSPTACRIVDVEAPSRSGRAASETRVRSFAVLPPAGPETSARLAEFTTAIGGDAHHVAQAGVTGGLPELRSMTVLQAPSPASPAHFCTSVRPARVGPTFRADTCTGG
jgi:hypothetical protein